MAHDTKEHGEGFEPSFRTKGERHLIGVHLRFFSQFVGLEIPAGKCPFKKGIDRSNN